MSGKRKTSW